MKNNIINICLFSLLSVIVGCGEENNPVETNGNGRGSINIGGYAIESQPTLSFNRDYIYYIADDTNNSTNSGICFAGVFNPIREKLISGENYVSPTVSSNRDRVAFLKFGKIYYYIVAADSMFQSNISKSYVSIKYINDSLIIGEISNQLNLININNDSVNFLTSGYDPTFYKKDTVVFLKQLEPDQYIINKLTIRAIPDDKTNGININVIPIDTIISSERIRWASVTPLLNRYTYSIGDFFHNSIYSSSPGDLKKYQIAESNESKPLIINFNKIIYTGEDGRFYYTDYTGSDTYPFWGEAGDPGK